MGNPGAFSYSHPLWAKGFLDALGSPHLYTAGSQDVNNRFAASALLYGSPLVVPIPDLQRTDFLLIVGANPLVSHGSVLTAPRVARSAQRDRRPRRAGRRRRPAPLGDRARSSSTCPCGPTPTPGCCSRCCTCCSPKGSPTSGRSPTRPRAPASSGRSPPSTRPRRPRSAPACRRTRSARSRGISRQRTAPPSTGGRARAWAASARWSRSCSTRSTSRPATSTAPGGAVFGRPAVALDDIGERFGLATYGKVRSRLGGFPDVIGNLPASLMAEEITTPGRPSDPRAVRHGRQPRPVGSRRRCARGGAGRARPLRLARPVRQRDQPPCRLRPARRDVAGARRRAGRVPRLLHDPVRAAHRRRGAAGAARRARSGRSSTTSRIGSGSSRRRSRRCGDSAGSRAGSRRRRRSTC